MTRRQVILLHGWTMRGSVFDGLVARLPHQLDCLAPDLPGHGSAVHLPPTLDAAADMLGDLVAQAPGPPLVVGWSMGAAVAWRHIARHGADGLAGLMTVDMSPRILPAEDWPHGLIGQTEASVIETTARMASDWPGAARAIAATMFAPASDPHPFGRAEALAQILSEDPAIMRAVWANLLEADARSAISSVTCPWLITYGARSRVYGAGVAEWLQARAPHSEVVGFPASGHSALLEEPETFAARLAGFAASL